MTCACALPPCGLTAAWVAYGMVRHGHSHVLLIVLYVDSILLTAAAIMVGRWLFLRRRSSLRRRHQRFEGNMNELP